MPARRLVLDANILVRAVLGKRVRDLITTYAVEAEFFTPEAAYEDAARHLPAVLTKFDRTEGVEEALVFLTQLRETVLPVPEEFYVNRETDASARIEMRDPDDWSVLAVALVFECPIWTEDNDFFGTGVPTWTTDRVELYLNPAD